MCHSLKRGEPHQLRKNNGLSQKRKAAATMWKEANQERVAVSVCESMRFFFSRETYKKVFGVSSRKFIEC